MVFPGTLNMTVQLTKKKKIVKREEISTYGISSGRTSDKIFIDSVLAFDVGAAASRSLRRAICVRKQNQWRILHLCPRHLGTSVVNIVCHGHECNILFITIELIN